MTVGAAFASGVGSALPGALIGGSRSQPPGNAFADPFFNDRSFVNVAPVGVNLGEILREMNSGPPENGGLGISLQSPVLEANVGAAVPRRVDIATVAIIGGGLIVLAIFLRRR